MCIGRSDLGKYFGMDIGGTLAKVVYLEKHHPVESEKCTDANPKRSRSPSLEVVRGEMNKFVNENEHFGQTGVRDVRLHMHLKEFEGVRLPNCCAVSSFDPIVWNADVPFHPI